VFLAICLTMFPVTALTFIVVKATHLSGQPFIYSVYFYSWLTFSVFYIARRNLRRTNAENLLLGSLLGFLVPVANGIFSNNWPWNTFSEGAIDILFVDLFWIAISTLGLVAFFKMNAPKKNAAVRKKITAEPAEQAVSNG